MAHPRSIAFVRLSTSRSRVCLFLFLIGLASCSGLGSLTGGEDEAPLPPHDPDAGADASHNDVAQPQNDANDVGVDAAPPLPACDPKKPFGIPVAITELNSAKEDIVSDVSADELTIFLASNDNPNSAPGVQSYYATRLDKTAPWGKRMPLFPIGSWDNWGVAITTDGLTAIVSSNRSAGNSELYVATRMTKLAAFGSLDPVLGVGINTGSNEEGPRWTADGKTLYFDSTKTGKRDIFFAPVTSSGSFGAVTPLTSINTPALEGAPVLTADELTLYFFSDRAPSSDGDIYMATRASKADTFTNVQLVPNVNSNAGLEAPGHITADGCTLYMASTRLGTFDIYVAKRPL